MFGIIDKERNQIISMRYHLVDILDEWNDLSCDYPKHQLIMFDDEKLKETASWSWTRRLDLSKATINTLLQELEALARKPVNGVHVRKIL